VTAEDNLQVISGHPVVKKNPCKNACVFLEHFIDVDLWWTPEPFTTASLQGEKSLQIREADARTRTGDPFITS
jgi:hypothetical protein